MTAQEEAAESLRQRAYHDPLTGLATRDVLLDRLAIALVGAHGSTGTVALLFVDLDRFKQVNDRFGHAAGDALLIEVVTGRSPMPCDRATWSPATAATSSSSSSKRCGASARPGPSPSGCEPRCAARSSIDDGVVIEPGRVRRRGPVRRRRSTAEAMLRDADAALYRAKASGRDRVEVFDDDLRRRALRRLDMELVLRQALEDDDVTLRFEPVADLRTGRIVGAEARRAPGAAVGRAGAVRRSCCPSPRRPASPRSSASRALEAACRAVVAWSDGVRRSRWVGLDVSAGEVTHPTFIERLAGVLAATGVEAGAVRLELPVEVVSQGTALTRRAIAAAQALGVLRRARRRRRRAAQPRRARRAGGRRPEARPRPPCPTQSAIRWLPRWPHRSARSPPPPACLSSSSAPTAPEQLDVVQRLGFRYVQGLAVAPMTDARELISR